jgi:F0F1-type ATP synthase assembly protein I
MSKKPLVGDLGDAAWVLGVGSQAGITLAGLVLAGLVVGYLIDRQLGTLPWITLVLTLVGAIAGPILVYRMVTRAVHARIEPPEEKQDIG